MTTLHQPFEFEPGETFVLEVMCKNAAGQFVGDVVSAEYHLGTAPGRSPVIALTLGNGITKGDQPHHLTIRVPATRTQDLEPGYYVDALRIVDDAGDASTQTAGRLKVTRRV